MTAYTLCIDSLVRGYHDYQFIWDNPLSDGDLLCVRECTGSSHNLQAMAIKKTIDGTLQVVGCVPRKISSICSMFLRGGSITLT